MDGKKGNERNKNTYIKYKSYNYGILAKKKCNLNIRSRIQQW